MVHEVTVCIVEGTMSGWGVGRPKRTKGKTAGAGLGNGPTCTGSSSGGELLSRKDGTGDPIVARASDVR